MTLPAQTAPPTFFRLSSPPPSPVSFPLGWLLEHSAPPIQYRGLTEVAALPLSAVPKALSLPYSFPPAVWLALAQSPDGTWGGRMLTTPSGRAERFDGVGTIPAVRRLLEYGWGQESPPLVRARRILFRLLAEDQDPSYLFEFGRRGGDEQLRRRGRAILREAAASVLAQAGYEDDPRLRGAARRIVGRVHSYLRSPLAQKPWVRVGNKQVLAPEAAPPSMYLLTMLAYMPLFRIEHHEAVESIYEHLTQPLPRQESAQLCGNTIVAQPHLVLGDTLPHRNAADADVPWALTWLELVARLGLLRRNENWTKLFERFLDDRDRDGVWHPHKGMAMPRTANPLVWPSFPLENRSTGDERWSDVTFRLGLIARLSGRQLDLI